MFFVVYIDTRDTADHRVHACIRSSGSTTKIHYSVYSDNITMATGKPKIVVYGPSEIKIECNVESMKTL